VGQLALLELLVHQDKQVHLELQDRLEVLEHQEPKAWLALLDPKDPQVMLEHKVLQDQQDQ
jgi:hypothetical protein